MIYNSPYKYRPDENGPNGCQKNWQDLKNLDMEVYCTNIQPKLKKPRSSTKNQSFLMASEGFLKFTQYSLNISTLTRQIYLLNIFLVEISPRTPSLISDIA